MKLGDFLKNLATKIGLQNDQALVDLLAKSEMADLDVNDAIANPIVKDLMSLDGAKNNSLVKTHFTSQALNGVDTELMTAVTELELGDDVISQFKDEKNTYNKLRILKDKVKEIKSKKVETNDQTKKAEYERQILELNQKIAKAIDYSKKSLTDLTAKHEKEIVNFMRQHSLQNKPYAQKDLRPEINIKIAESLLDDELTKSGAILVRDGNLLKLKQASNPELDLYIDHKPVSYDDFVTKILADNKLLQVTQAPPVTPIPGQFAQRIPGHQDQRQVDTTKINDALSSSFADLQNT